MQTIKRASAMGLILLAAIAVSKGQTAQYFGTAVPNAIGASGNNVSGDNVVTQVSSAWHAPIQSSKWVSTTADSKTASIPTGALVDFTFDFELKTAPTAAMMTILVDDSALVLVNTKPVVTSLRFPLGTNCDQAQPNCTDPLNLDIHRYLKAGKNHIDVFVEQRSQFTYFGADVFGWVVQ
jgi:hypothetical protein